MARSLTRSLWTIKFSNAKMICSFGTILLIQQKSFTCFLPMHFLIHSKPSPRLPIARLNETQTQNRKRKPPKARPSQQKVQASKDSTQKDIGNKKTLNRKASGIGELKNVRHCILSRQTIQKHGLPTIYKRHQKNKNIT